MEADAMIEIIKETKHFLLVNKPSAMIVERSPFEAVTVETLVHDYLSKQYRNPYVGIVHRLDKVTSGALIIAKRKSTLKKLNEQFRDKQVEKIYWAVVQQQPEKDKDLLTHWLVKDQKNKCAIVYDEEVKGSSKCQLEYEVIAKKEGLYLLEIKPLSGKFHQIRAQLSAIQCPILGDEKYGGKKCAHDRMIALHARSLKFEYPNTQEMIFAIASLPTNELWTPFLDLN